MKANVQMWGNSLAVRIPRGFAKETGIERGAVVDITIRDGAVIITPARRPRYRLSELLKGLTPKCVHREITWGPSRGNEAW